MKTSSIYLLIGIIVFVIGTFAWQYVLHLQLKDTPIACTSGTTNTLQTCPLGQTCVYTETQETKSNSSSDNSAVNTIIDFKSGGKNKSGYCQPWFNAMLKLSPQS